MNEVGEVTALTKYHQALTCPNPYVYGKYRIRSMQQADSPSFNMPYPIS